ncbi:MAG: hypothetical protein ACFFAE_19395 [Candidatus Hodarchaeota archaeon]
MLETLGIPYVVSNVLATAVFLNKAWMALMAYNKGINYNHMIFRLIHSACHRHGLAFNAICTA